MEIFGVLIGLGVLLFLLVAPIIALIHSSKALRSVEETEKQLAEMRAKLLSLERGRGETPDISKKVAELEIDLTRLKKQPPATTPARVVESPGAGPVEPPATPSMVAGAAAKPPEAPKPAAPASAVIPLERPAVPQPPAESKLIPSTAPAPRAAAPVAPVPAAARIEQKPTRNLEDLLGATLFTKLGVILLVIGMTFLLMTQWHRFSPGLKIAIGYLTAALMLAPGIYFEKRERWRILARAGIGGGWALAFFVTFAMHHIAASRIISSEAVDLVLMLIVAGAMVIHTLKYRSQMVTGLAFFLAFTTVAISNVAAFSLFASAILALALVVLVLRMRWYELEVFGILATFLNHYYWLRPILARVGMHHYFPLYAASSALLIFYWLLFRVSFLARKIREDREEKVSLVAALLNVGLFLGIMGYQAVHPPHPFWFFFLVGAAELAFGQLPWTRRRRPAFVVLTALGAVLLVTAFPYKFSGANLSLVWLADAEAFFLVGIFLRETVFRRLGMLAGLLTAFQILIEVTRQVNHLRGAAGAGIAVPHLGFVYGAAALAFYLNSHFAPRTLPDIAKAALDRIVLQVASYLGTVMAVFALWAAVPEKWTAVAWAALVPALAWTSAYFKAREMGLSAAGVAVLAFIRILSVDLGTTGFGHHVPARLAAVGLSAMLIYLASPGAARLEASRRLRLPEAYTWAASSLVALLAWYELRPVSVALAWMIFGLLLFEVGFARRSASLRLQGYVALASSFLRLFFVNLGAAGEPGQISPRVWTTIPVALAFYYVFWRVKDQSETAYDLDRRLRVSDYHCFMGTIAVAALMRAELDAQWVIAGWAVAILLLLALARQWKLKIFLLQGILLGAAILGRGVLYNFFERSYFSHNLWTSRPAAVGVTVALLFFVLVLAFPLRSKPGDETNDGGAVRRFFAALIRRPDQVFFFLPVLLLTILLMLDLRSGMVTLAWGAEGVAIFLLALMLGERSFRLTGLGLLSLCVGKIVLVDVWALHGTDRYLTLIGLGMALLLVSALYTRYRGAIHKYL